MIFWVLSHLIELYSWAIVIYALLSWFPGAYQTAFGQFLARIVEPFQRWFNFAHIGMIGFAPIVALIVLQVVSYGLTFVEQIIFRLLGY
ncbi:YggT family protein [Secundilactobacillus collinoides]|uniref:Cell division protein n=1 Tax=Secundilactobacillus collinoides TaxID=33960 RepID=A0A166HJJ7_SECCO|nr:YggT family protein [Secundilactobacillus collinoides]KZL42787.1 cell division protein [Secundilactobacillus collinoides]